MIYNFKEFLTSLIQENLHPELQKIVSEHGSNISKQTQLAKKIKELSAKGEKTGIEGNMPKGSSRAYLKHEAPHPINIDGHDTTMRVGTKVAIKAPLDKYHYSKKFDGSLGQMQNKAENGDYLVNSNHRVLTEDEHGNYHTNENGIFPPLIHHDFENHEHSIVGHCEKITKTQFKQLTKTESHPNGISHEDFASALNRDYRQTTGRYWDHGPEREAELDHVAEHPLVQKFLDHQHNWGSNPADYQQLGNMGRWKHPITGKEYIVARDHGYGADVEKAYENAIRHRYEEQYRSNSTFHALN